MLVRILLLIVVVAFAVGFLILNQVTSQPDIPLNPEGRRIEMEGGNRRLVIAYDPFGRVIYRKVVEPGRDDVPEATSSPVPVATPQPGDAPPPTEAATAMETPRLVSSTTEADGRVVRWYETESNKIKVVLKEDGTEIFRKSWPKNAPTPTVEATEAPTAEPTVEASPTPAPTPGTTEEMVFMKRHQAGNRVIEWYKTPTARVRLVLEGADLVSRDVYPIAPTEPPSPTPSPTPRVAPPRATARPTSRPATPRPVTRPPVPTVRPVTPRPATPRPATTRPVPTRPPATTKPSTRRPSTPPPAATKQAPVLLSKETSPGRIVKWYLTAEAKIKVVYVKEKGRWKVKARNVFPLPSAASSDGTPEATPEAPPTPTPPVAPAATPAVVPTPTPDAPPAATPSVAPAATSAVAPTPPPDAPPVAGPPATSSPDPSDGEGDATPTPSPTPEATSAPAAETQRVEWQETDSTMTKIVYDAQGRIIFKQTWPK